jgi:hypothetical protein
VLRAVIRGRVYLTVLGLIGLGLGSVLRSSAGALDAGFDAVDAGALSQGRRFPSGTPPYVQWYTADGLTNALNWTS